MIDRTINSRIARYTERQHQRGMVRVRVWVPNKDDAEEIRKLAEKMRENVKNMTKTETQSDQIEGLSRELSDHVVNLLRHRETFRNPRDDRGPVLFNAALEEAMEEIKAAQEGVLTPSQKDDPIRYDLEKKITDIGVKANELGGGSLMKRVLDRTYHIIADQSERDAEMSEGVIDHRWDGIGGWAC